MYLAPLLTLLKEAMDRTFDDEFPEPDFRNMKVSLEYPADVALYPGIWVDFSPVGELQVAGVDHAEYSEASETGRVRPLRRWTFQGYATYTIVALSSFERARIFDQVINVLAFGDQAGGALSEFRQTIEDNDLIACNFDFDQIGVGGFAQAPGTPWGTDEIIYEATVTMECLGEFVSDLVSATLVPLSAVRIYEYPQGQPDPTLSPPASLDPSDWH